MIAQEISVESTTRRFPMVMEPALGILAAHQDRRRVSDGP